MEQTIGLTIDGLIPLVLIGITENDARDMIVENLNDGTYLANFNNRIIYDEEQNFICSFLFDADNETELNYL